MKDSQNYDVIVHAVENFYASLFFHFNFLRAGNKPAIRNYQTIAIKTGYTV